MKHPYPLSLLFDCLQFLYNFTASLIEKKTEKCCHDSVLPCLKILLTITFGHTTVTWPTFIMFIFCPCKLSCPLAALPPLGPLEDELESNEKTSRRQGAYMAAAGGG